MLRIFLTVISCLLIACSATSFAGNTTESSGQTTIVMEPKTREKAPLVVIFTTSTCSHCREAKEYLTRNNIPFINREVDTDDEHLFALMNIYDSMGIPEQKRGVPLLVIADRIRLQGFNKDTFQNALKEVTSNPKQPL